MLHDPVSHLQFNTVAFETIPLIKPTGFREYDARWRYPEEINLLGVQLIGMALGTMMKRCAVNPPSIIVGHDYHSYSLSIKQALIVGLMTAGAHVFDIGLALSPMAYFARFDLDIPAVAMVTASHNRNGWTGFKMGFEPPLTFGPEEMSMLREIVLLNDVEVIAGGSYRFVPDAMQRYSRALIARWPGLKRRIRLVASCGNGTAGIVAPYILRAIGGDVIAVDAQPNHDFPHCNPNPEDIRMLDILSASVLESGADIGFAFDGDGDRCGVVDHKGNIIFSDKLGLMLARDISAVHRDAIFVVDVKSTSLFAVDPVLAANGATVDYWKTGHSHMKSRIKALGAIAGFEKSGHFFFAPPLGYGHDDALSAACAVLDMMDRHPGSTLADLYEALPLTWQSPTMSPYCRDEVKYDVVERVSTHFEGMERCGDRLAGQDILDINKMNGVRITLSDGSWGLVRASSNGPQLVVLVESPVSEERMHAVFSAIDAHLALYPEIGDYDQRI